MVVVSISKTRRPHPACKAQQRAWGWQGGRRGGAAPVFWELQGFGGLGLGIAGFGELGLGTAGFGELGVGTAEFVELGMGIAGFGELGLGTEEFGELGVGTAGVWGTGNCGVFALWSWD